MQQSARLKYQQVTILEDKELGWGNYGKVCKAMCDDLPCAVKLLNPKIFQFVADSVSPGLERFKQDCEMLHSITHPSIVQYIDAYVQADTGQAVLLMELMDESLTSFLDRCLTPLPAYIQIDICYDVIQALSYLHSNSIVHRNLTGHNVLVRAGSRAKVADFGMMKMIHSQQVTNPYLKHMTLHATSSSSYMPPEAFRFPPSYSDQIDIFSFGVITLQVLTRQLPQPSASKVSEIERRKSDISLVEVEHILLPLMLSCLKDTDILRPPAAQLCRKLKQLQDSPVYSESRQKREEALQEVDAIHRELSEVQRKNDNLVAQVESLQLENKQLSKLISKYSENITSKIHNGEFELVGSVFDA